MDGYHMWSEIKVNKYTANPSLVLNRSHACVWLKEQFFSLPS